MSAIYYHDESQLAAIERTRDKFVSTPDKLQTEIAPFEKFWIAEDYHQKYRLRRATKLLADLRAIYPDEADFVASTAAARINGYLAGHGSEQQFEREIDQLGLSPAARDLLRSAR